MFPANGLFVFQRFSPADRAGLEKMDYVYCVNNKEVSHHLSLHFNTFFYSKKFF